MKMIFDELEAEVDQNAVNRKCDEIKRKNILIAADTSLANCLSKEVFYIATNSKLNVSRFSEMHDAHTVVQARCLELETDLSKLKDKIQKDDHDVMDGSDFDSVFEIKKLKVSIQGKDNVIRKLRTQISQLQGTRSDADHSVTPKVLAPGMYVIDFEPIPRHLRNNRKAHLDYLKHLKESVATLREIVKEAKVERPLDRPVAYACLYTIHSQELLQHLIGTLNALSSDKNVMRKLREQYPLTRFTHPKLVHAKQPKNVSTSKSVITKNSSHTSQKPLTRQFYDSDLEVAFRKHSCYVCDMDGIELIKGSCGSNLYTISVEDMMKSSPICLLSKASMTKLWLWHHCLNHLNFGTINDLKRNDLVRGLPRLKFEKDNLCSACQLRKRKKHTHLPKAENTNLEVLNKLHMDLCGIMRVQTISGKKYILVVIDDYMRFTWVKFLRSKDETPEVVIKFLKQIQVKVVATACCTQNRSLIQTRHNKTSYELVHSKKPDLTFLRIFGALCYPTNDNADLGKLQTTADIGIFDMYESWRSRMELYMLNRQHGRMILESVEHGPFLWHSVTEDGVIRLKKYSELSSTEAIQADCDVKATNIILQALPPKIYAL
nr:retrovirus-related Pol polyprotein from transposon TNT 1-94 [Tanacetum cinerariifolium]